VDGKISKRVNLLKTLRQSLTELPEINLAVEKEFDEKSKQLMLTVEVTLPAGSSKKIDKVDIQAIIIEDGLNTAVSRGENKGENLNEHAVVRQESKSSTVLFQGKKTLTEAINFKINKDWKVENLTVAVTARNPETFAVYQAWGEKLKDNAPDNKSEENSK